MPKFTFYGGRKQATTKLSFSFQTGEQSPRNQLQANLPTLDIFQGIGINATKFEKTLIHFKSDVFAALAVVDSKIPYYCMLLLNAYC